MFILACQELHALGESRFDQNSLRSAHSNLANSTLNYAAPVNRSGSFFRPQHALIFLCDRRHAFVDEFLHALSAVSFCREDIALRIRSDAMHRVEFSRLASAVAKAGQDF